MTFIIIEKIGADIYLRVFLIRRGNYLEQWSYAPRKIVREQGVAQGNPARESMILKYLAILP